MDVEISEFETVEPNKKHVYRSKEPLKNEEIWEDNEFVRLKTEHYEIPSVIFVIANAICKGVFISNVPKIFQILPSTFVKTNCIKIIAKIRSMPVSKETNFSVIVCMIPKTIFVFKKGVYLLNVDKKIALEVKRCFPLNPVFSVCNSCLRTANYCFIVGEKTTCKRCVTFGDLGVGFMYRLDDNYYCQWEDEEIEITECCKYEGRIKSHGFMCHDQRKSWWYSSQIELMDHNIVYDDII